jgi:ABC-type sulfate transport system permease component
LDGLILVSLASLVIGLLIGYRLGQRPCLLREALMLSVDVPPVVPYRGSWPPADLED